MTSASTPGDRYVLAARQPPPDAVTTLDANEQVVTAFGNGAAVDRFTPSDGTVSGWRPMQ